jgi:hypothetical protein
VKTRYYGLLLVLLVAGCSDFDRNRYLPTSPDTLDALRLDPSPATMTSIRADGGTRVRIEARVKPGSTAKTVKFTTTLGTLLAGGAAAGASATEKDVDADVTGLAAVDLQSAAAPGIARVTASVAIPGTTQTIVRTLDIQFTAVGPGEVITLTPEAGNHEADGATRVRLVATVAQSLPTGSREVTFTTTDGKFATHATSTDEKTAKVVADSSGAARVELIAPRTPGRVTVTAVVSNFSTHGEVTFTRALPDVIFVELNESSITRALDDSAEVTVTLLRDTGKVSNNTAVTFEARDSAGTAIGTFSKITLAKDDSASGEVKATAVFNPDDGAAAGVAIITVRAGTRSGTVPVRLD